jgi:hypothetical protein
MSKQIYEPKIHLSCDGTDSPEARDTPVWSDKTGHWKYISTGDVNKVTCEVCLQIIKGKQDQGLPLVV